MKRKLTRAERSWITYDWANSAYSIVITTAIFPIFYESITPTDMCVVSSVTRGDSGSARELSHHVSHRTFY